jgi:hypothetical protein
MQQGNNHIDKNIKELFILSKCKTKAAYSTRLKGQHYKLDLKLLAKEFEVIIETPVVIVIKVNSIVLTAHNFGELLFRNTDDLDLMQSIAEQVYEKGLKRK